MTKLTAHISISLDGFAAGPNQTLEEPLGAGGEQLHEWAVRTASWREQHGREGGEENVDGEILRKSTEGVGAVIMGRRMFGGGEGPWDESWQGWWGDEPPFHGPVFVLTHHPREPLQLTGTTFTFITDGIESALDQARAAAGAQDVMVAGGASAIRQYLKAGLLDELHLHVASVLLGGGTRLFEDVGTPRLEQLDVVAGSGVTHVSYRVAR